MKLRQISFKLVSMVMVIAMMFGMCATTISATVAATADEQNDETKGTLNYVSVGDSMTNGYGFEGYNQDEHFNHVGKEGTYNYFTGDYVYGEGSYANQFAAWLEGHSGKEVNHTKLALSGLRAEDVAFLLGAAGEPADGDDTFWNYAWVGGTFKPGTSFGTEDFEYNTEHSAEAQAQLAQIQNYFQTSFKNADVISLALGNASFNNYLQKALFNILHVFGA